MYTVILCGGSGTRLWPLSRRNYAKQFLRLYSERSLLQATYARARKLLPMERVLFITNENGFPYVVEQIREIDPEFDLARILIEPASLNTAPAIALAVKYILTQMKADPHEPIAFLPSDHYIHDTEEYVALLDRALKTVGENIGTIGIRPTKPETGYGYIRKGKQQEAYCSVLQFCEKPPRQKAEEYLESGEYVWNAGMYLFSPKTFLRETEMHAPEIFGQMQKEWEVFLDTFSSLSSVSIDYAVSEKSKNVVVYEGDFGWSDIGSFDSLAELGEGNFPTRHIGIDSTNVFVHSQNDRLIATIGLENIAIIEAGDSILVYQRGRAEEVRKITDILKNSGGKEIDRTKNT